jgi:cytochrome P450
VRDELMTLLGAGHETTASGLAWTWMLLAQHPRARERMHAELDQVLGSRVASPPPRTFRRLLWTSAVVQESVRLYSPVMGTRRR